MTAPVFNPIRAGARAAAILGVVLCAACASPAARFVDDARERGFTVREARVGQAPLIVIEKGPSDSTTAVHFYLDGDGTPWLARGRIVADPTTRERLILALMAQDPARAVLVGRPCYYRQENGCDPALWTTERYGDFVVAALVAQLNREIEHLAGASITLVGYSGGGALAMLVAPRLTRLDNLVTVAANLDVTAWAALHRYPPLHRSLNPADEPPLAARIHQAHLFGQEDDNVPGELMRAVADRQPGARVQFIRGYDHECCWADNWRQLLRDALAPAE